MIKPLKVSDKSVRRFKTHKKWNYDNITSSDEILLEQSNADGSLSLFIDEQTVLAPEQSEKSTSLKVSRGKRYSASDTFYPKGHKLHDPSFELTNTDGTYQRVVYNSIKHLFYNEYGVSPALSSTGSEVKNPLMVFGSETGNYMMQSNAENQIFNKDTSTGYERRFISDDIIVVQFDSSQMGEKIKPGEFRIRDYSSPYGVLEIVDDGATNLVISTSSFNEIKEVSGSITNVTQITRDNKIFDFNDLTFGYKLSSAGKYFISGQPVMEDAPTEVNSGRAVMYKLDDDQGEFKVLRQFTNPFTQNGLSIELQNDNTGFLMTELEGLLVNEDYSVNDNFGDAVELNHNTCVIGSSKSHIRGVCSKTGATGHVFVYDKEKGGADHWGLVNILEGEPGTEFGSSVSIKGSYMAVGAPGHNKSEGAIYLFKRGVRTENHPWKRISNSHDDYTWSDSEGVYIGKPTGLELDKNNKWIPKWNITSLVPNADTLNHFYRDDSELLYKRCTEAGLIQYDISPERHITDQDNGVTTSAWAMSGILATSPADQSESSAPYPVDVYDSSDNFLGHVTYTGKPKIMSLYFSFGEGGTSCISGTIENNVCRMTGGILPNQCSEPGFTEYRVSFSEKIDDQVAGVTSSNWMKPGILSISDSDSSTSVAPYPVDVYDSTNTLVGHLTYTGRPSSMNLYFRTSDQSSECVYGRIDGHICVLPVELVMSGTQVGDPTEQSDGTPLSGKLIAGELNDYRVSPTSSIQDQKNGVVSSTWSYEGILSIPTSDSINGNTPFPIDIYDADENFVGHITYSGAPSKSIMYFTTPVGDRFFGSIEGGRCDIRHLLEGTPGPDLELDECTEDGFNTYEVSSEVVIDDSDWGVKSSTWTYNGTISVSHADTKYGNQPYVVDVYDFRNILLGTITYYGNPYNMNIYFKRTGSVGCESGVIADNKCKLTPYDIVDADSYKEGPCDSMGAIEIETFDGVSISTEATVSGFPPSRYDEYEDGTMTPAHAVGDVTWDLVEVIKIPGSRRLGEGVKLTSDSIYATTPSSRFKYCSVLSKLDEPTECGVGWRHTYNITKDGIYNFNTDPVGLGDGFSDISYEIQDNEVTITVVQTDEDAEFGFVYRVNTPLNESSEDELINHNGIYVNGGKLILTLTNGVHDIYVGRTTKDSTLLGRQSRINLAINPIYYNEPKRGELVKYPYEYDYNVDGNFGVSLDANENVLIIGDSFDREYTDPANTQDKFRAGATYVYSTLGGKISFTEKMYSESHEEFRYSSEFGRSVSLKGTDFLVGSPCSDASDISVLDGGENVGVRDFRRGTKNISDTHYTSEETIFTDAECSYVGGNMPDAVVKISVDTMTVDYDLISEFMISADFINTDLNSLFSVKFPRSYKEYQVSSTKTIADESRGIISSEWTTEGTLVLPNTSTSVDATPTPVDIYDTDNNFMGHVTVTGNFLSDTIYFVSDGVSYVGQIKNAKCKLTLYTQNLGAVTRGVYRDLTRFENGQLWFYVDVNVNTPPANESTGWHEQDIEFVYYAKRNAEEGNVYYYRAGNDGVERMAHVKTNKYPYKVRHQFGTAVTLSSEYIYVGCPIMGNFPISGVEAFEGSDIGLFEQCSTIYSEYGDIAWGRLSNMDIDISGKVLAYDVASIRDSERVYVGNVFYKNGIAVITNTSDYFSNMFTGSNDSGFEVSYRGTHAIYENEILCSINPSEFNVSTNPTSVVFGDIDYDVNGDKKFDIKDLAYIYRYMIGSLVEIKHDTQETYVVGPETLETICRENGIPYPSQIDIEASATIPVESSFGFVDIRRYTKGVTGNKLRYNDTIVPGDTLRLPSGHIHTVSPVQSIQSVAKFTGATVDAIQTANFGIASESLYIGQILTIPAGGDYTPGVKMEEGNNTNWPNDDLVLTESEDVVLMNVLLRSTEGTVNANEYRLILSRLESLEERGLLDIDGDGIVTHVDAKLLVRYFVGRTGTDLTDGLIDTFTNTLAKQTRSVAYQIIEFLDDRTGKNRGIEILQDFVDYRENDAKDQLGSYLAPYVTTIGLYSGLDLVMVAKLSKPVKIVPNYPINFLVKYDT